MYLRIVSIKQSMCTSRYTKHFSSLDRITSFPPVQNQEVTYNFLPSIIPTQECSYPRPAMEDDEDDDGDG